MQVEQPGIYTMPLTEYLADPAPSPSMSSGIAHAMLEESPLHAFWKHPRLNPHYQPEVNEKFDLGSAAHAVLLEGDYKKIAVIKATDYRTKEAKETRDAAREACMIPVLVEQMMDIEEMVEAAKLAIAESELAEVFTPDGGDSEQTLIWQDDGVWCKSRPDRLSKDRRIIVDYKTTGASAEPNTWMKGPMIGNGCDLQAALGLRGIKALTNEATLSYEPQFIFLVQENYAPYAVSFVGFGPQFQHYADVRLSRAMKIFKRCWTRNEWPGYPTQTAWVAPPPWKLTEWDAQVEAIDAEKEPT